MLEKTKWAPGEEGQSVVLYRTICRVLVVSVFDFRWQNTMIYTRLVLDQNTSLYHNIKVSWNDYCYYLAPHE